MPTRPRRPQPFITVGILLTSALSAAAQPDAAPTAPPQAVRASVEGGPLINLRFEGGSLEEFAGAIRLAAEPTKVNIIIPAGAGAVRIPPVDIEQAGVATALESLTHLLGQDSQVGFGIKRISPVGEPSMTFAILYHDTRRQQALPFPPGVPIQRPDRRAAVYSLRDLTHAPPGLGDFPEAVTSIDSVVNAVEGAMRLATAEDEPRAEVMLHPDSNIMIVRGTRDQHEVVEGVLETLASGLDQTREAIQSRLAAQRQARLERATEEGVLRQAIIDVRRAEHQVEIAEQHARRLRAEGVASEMELRQADDQAETARLVLEQAKSHLRMLKEREAINTSIPSAADDLAHQARTYDVSALGPVAADFAALARKLIADPSGDRVSIQNNQVTVRASTRDLDNLQSILETMLAIQRNNPNQPTGATTPPRPNKEAQPNR